MTVIIASRRESAERIAVAIADLHGAALGQLGSATRKTAPITIAGAPSGGATTLGQEANPSSPARSACRRAWRRHADSCWGSGHGRIGHPL